MQQQLAAATTATPTQIRNSTAKPVTLRDEAIHHLGACEGIVWNDTSSIECTPTMTMFVITLQSCGCIILLHIVRCSA